MKGYKVDFAKETIVVTKKFMEEASVINSAAFKEMLTLRKLGMAIVVREVKPRKKNTITFAQMIQYISLVEHSDAYLAEFNVIRAEAGSKNARYNRVLKWFLKTFPNFYELPSLNEKNKIIVNTAAASCPLKTPEEKTVVALAS